jgi:D-sedoheptulose 7-phosphate isomerase
VTQAPVAKRGEQAPVADAPDAARWAQTLSRRLDEALAERTRANRTFFEADAERLARLCHRMAERFARGGRLVAFGRSPGARSDARHVAVEFVHPVIVGKRALPAIGLAGEGGPLGQQVDLVVEPDDIAIAFGVGEDGGEAAEALTLARGRGCLTIAFHQVGAPGAARGAQAEWEFAVPSADPSVRQELVETLYHVLWELVHVFFDHRGLLEGREARTIHDTGASSFLYPFLSEGEHDLEAVVDDVRRSALAKAEEVGALRAQTLNENRDELGAAAAGLRQDLDAGGRLLALGNGGSATDAMDVVADFREPPDPRWPARRAMDLTEDAAIITAIANDIGTEAIFARQVIAHGRAGDALLALSTSGNSGNVIEALAEARRRGLRTIAMVGYDGGRVAAERLADHVVVTRSEHIPRIQEAQASAYHVLRELVEIGGEPTRPQQTG